MKETRLAEATGIQRHRLRALFVGNKEREHSGADCLNHKIFVLGQYVTRVKCKEWVER